MLSSLSCGRGSYVSHTSSQIIPQLDILQIRKAISFNTEVAINNEEIILLKHFCKLLQQFYQLVYMVSGVSPFICFKNLDKFKI